MDSKTSLLTPTCAMFLDKVTTPAPIFKTRYGSLQMTTYGCIIIYCYNYISIFLYNMCKIQISMGNITNLS